MDCPNCPESRRSLATFFLWEFEKFHLNHLNILLEMKLFYIGLCFFVNKSRQREILVERTAAERLRNEVPYKGFNFTDLTCI